MKIRKGDLRRIIAEEIIASEGNVANLEERVEAFLTEAMPSIFGGGRKGKAPTSNRKKRPKGRASADPDYDGADVMDAYRQDVEEAEDTKSFGRKGKAIIDRAKELDVKSFERVMKWANEQGLVTKDDIANASQADFERVMKWANEQGLVTKDDTQALAAEVTANEKDIDALQKISAQTREVMSGLGELGDIEDLNKRLNTYFATKTDLRNVLAKLNSQATIDALVDKVAEKMAAAKGQVTESDCNEADEPDDMMSEAANKRHELTPDQDEFITGILEKTDGMENNYLRTKLMAALRNQDKTTPSTPMKHSSETTPSPTPGEYQAAKALGMPLRGTGAPFEE